MCKEAVYSTQNWIQIYFVYTAFLYCMHPVFWLFYPFDIELSWEWDEDKFVLGWKSTVGRANTEQLGEFKLFFCVY